MSMPKDETQKEIVESWRTFVDSLEKSLNQLEKDIKEADEMTDICTNEWCESTEHVIDEISNALFSISEPRWATAEDSQKLKNLKRKVHNLYADYRDVYKKAG
jgi:DNA-binding ferritin-like protein